MKSEARVQSEVRVKAASLGAHLFRNNVGQLLDEHGRPVRYGLANESKALNAELKSADLIGWTSVTITPEWVGRTVAVFTSIECKPEGWTGPSNAAERKRYEAQMRWHDLVRRAGGYAQICHDAEQLLRF